MPRDLADRLRLRGWSNAKMGLAWTVAVAIFGLLLLVDFWLREPFRKIDVATLAVGSLAILNAIYNEARGRYSTRAKIVYRETEPDKFRRQTSMLVWTGLCLCSIGLFFQAWGFCSVLGFYRGKP